MGGRVNCLLPPSVDRRDPWRPPARPVISPHGEIGSFAGVTHGGQATTKPGGKYRRRNRPILGEKELFSRCALSANPQGSMLQVSILLVEPCSGAIRALSDLPLKIDLKSLPRRLYGEQFFYG
ncbi:hypothetical protein EN745_20965 [Mesorhizobium sp. M4A.F.Ca.ET.022.05.2.1]|uniref:hypothetical protein n=1 Tax=Mesorhizobium sp. M4A.F.Ca.ET.022.05.2.1 TaxID=2496653 RepID=UPI000FCAD233|nr:hypothetical protein [Mesorhizobium sp. M4A.F.Ca.ET.022.05.2.1]RVC77755.1 hypothetical protein EN745_20965 [Mesorhizobium sp. M4A.F.Ca.ET.022.05.2.1]